MGAGPEEPESRTHGCQSCGLVMDRDENAARNILLMAQAELTARNRTAGQAETGSGRMRTLLDRPPLRLCSQGHVASGLVEGRISRIHAARVSK